MTSLRQSKLNSKNPKSALLGMLTLLLGIASCASVDKSLREDFAKVEHLQSIAFSQPKITGPVGLEEALARAFVYNVDLRASRLKAIQALDNAGLSKSELLPQVSAYASATRRSNIQAAVGQRVAEMGEELPTDFFTASDQSNTYGSVLATWNLLDFGLSMLEQKKRQLWANNETLQAQISCASLASDVVSTFWRAKAFERANKKRQWLQWRLEEGLSSSRELAENYPEQRTGELLMQRELIDLYRWYDAIFVSLSGAKAELIGLMNLSNGEELDVDLTTELEYSSKIPNDHVTLIRMAFENRPEFVQRALFENINQISDRQSLIRMLPSISVLLGVDADSNSFLLNNSFTKIGTDISWNLFELSRASNRERLISQRGEAFQIETELVARAIASQVLLSAAEYQARSKSLEYAWRANTIQSEIANQKIQMHKRGEAPLSHVVKEEILRELSIIRRDVDEADHQASLIRTLNALGIGPNCSTLPIHEGFDAVLLEIERQRSLSANSVSGNSE
ncbi:MAG: TolC family protein [Hyphomonas sp.]